MSDPNKRDYEVGIILNRCYIYIISLNIDYFWRRRPGHIILIIVEAEPRRRNSNFEICKDFQSYSQVFRFETESLSWILGESTNPNYASFKDTHYESDTWGIFSHDLLSERTASQTTCGQGQAHRVDGADYNASGLCIGGFINRMLCLWNAVNSHGVGVALLRVKVRGSLARDSPLSITTLVQCVRGR